MGCALLINLSECPCLYVGSLSVVVNEWRTPINKCLYDGYSCAWPDSGAQSGEYAFVWSVWEYAMMGLVRQLVGCAVIAN